LAASPTVSNFVIETPDTAIPVQRGMSIFTLCNITSYGLSSSSPTRRRSVWAANLLTCRTKWMWIHNALQSHPVN